jgi:hypothetical protein
MNIYNSGELRWVTSCGGPLILLPQYLLSQWLGCYMWCNEPEDKSDGFETPHGWLCFNEDFMEPAVSDYGRACATGASRAFVKVGADEALVLDNEDNDDNPATWLASASDDGGTVFQWNYLHTAKDQDQLVREVFRQQDTLKWQNEAFWEIKCSELVLFDSAGAGPLLNRDAAGYLLISVEPGSYSVTTAEYYRPGGVKLLTLHRLIHRRD